MAVTEQTPLLRQAEREREGAADGQDDRDEAELGGEFNDNAGIVACKEVPPQICVGLAGWSQ